MAQAPLLWRQQSNNELNLSYWGTLGVIWIQIWLILDQIIHKIIYQFWPFWVFSGPKSGFSNAFWWSTPTTWLLATYQSLFIVFSSQYCSSICLDPFLGDSWERAKTVLRYKNKHIFFRFITRFLKTHRIVGLGHAPFWFWRVPASRRLYKILKTHITCTHVLLNIRHFGPENVFHTILRLFLLVLLGDSPAWAVGYFKIRLCVRILK